MLYHFRFVHSWANSRTEFLCGNRIIEINSDTQYNRCRRCKYINTSSCALKVSFNKIRIMLEI